LKDQVTLASYAKVNYTLDVLSKRPDGYHNLSSIMQTISLADEIELLKTSNTEITMECETPLGSEDIPCDSANLAWRAAEAILQFACIHKGVHIHLKKQIPSQAGLGGGSSNAAAVLLGIDRLFDLNIPYNHLIEIAARLGSDVPFFLQGGCAAVRGRGEIIKLLPDSPELWFVIIKPDANISTRLAYGSLDSLPNRVSARSTGDMESALAAGEAGSILARMTNDFEQVVLDMSLPITILHDDLQMARAQKVLLCGSGAAVFGACASREDAETVAQTIRLKYSQVFLCRALKREESSPFHPLKAVLQKPDFPV
jgi:4-diphosphocytidyl-2-C-methyl-D-erythritol kinase